MVPVLVLLFVALWFILRGDMLYVLPCVILFLCFSVLLVLRLPDFGEERANLSAFSTFVRFVLVWICRFPFSLCVWEGLRFVTVALPGLFSYLFFSCLFCDIVNLNISSLAKSLSLLKEIVRREKSSMVLWLFIEMANLKTSSQATVFQFFSCLFCDIIN